MRRQEVVAGSPTHNSVNVNLSVSKAYSEPTYTKRDKLVEQSANN